MPPLRSLPPQWPTEDRIKKYLPPYEKFVLDQGEDGACTGFGLAALINYVRFAQSVEAGTDAPERVSTRMLYHLARKYDEWPGEDYEGSSCRGAMKGWFHHGVVLGIALALHGQKGQAALCEAKSRAGRRCRVPSGWARITASTPNFIADIVGPRVSRSARSMCRATCMADGTWRSARRPISTIPWTSSTKPDGGHAFALVGYDAQPFHRARIRGVRAGAITASRGTSMTTGSRHGDDEAWGGGHGRPDPGTLTFPHSVDHPHGRIRCAAPSRRRPCQRRKRRCRQRKRRPRRMHGMQKRPRSMR